MVGILLLLNTLCRPVWIFSVSKLTFIDFMFGSGTSSSKTELSKQSLELEASYYDTLLLQYFLCDNDKLELVKRTFDVDLN